MPKYQGKKALNVDVPLGLYNVFAKICIDDGITKTEGIVQYFKYLQRQKHNNKRRLSENSESSFKLHDTKSQ